MVSNIEIAKHIFEQLKVGKYVVQLDPKLDLKFKRRVHDALMELYDIGLLKFDVEVDDDVFYVREMPTVGQIKNALIKSQFYLNKLDYDENYDFVVKESRLKSMIKLLEKKTNKKVMLV